MKKFALMFASVLLVLSAASAMAAVPSKTTTDVTHVKSVETVKEDGKTEAAGWDIDVTEDEAPVIEEIAKIYDWVAAKGKSAVSYFPEETQQAIAALLPEGFKLENMTMNEFVTLMLTGDVDALNDAIAQFKESDAYEIEIDAIDVMKAANLEKRVPIEWINEAGNDITPTLYNYLYPLILGEVTVPYNKGIPQYLSISHLEK